MIRTKKRRVNTVEHLRTQTTKTFIPQLNFPEIIENITDGIVIFDRQWRFIYLNKLSESLFIKKDLIGKNIWKEFPQAKGTIYYKEYHRAIRTNRATHFEYYERYSDKWFSISAYPFHGGLIVYYTDITQQKTAENLVRLSETRYRSLFDTTLDGILISDDQGTYIDVNKSYAKLLKTTREKLIGANFAQFIPDDLLDGAASALGSLKTKGSYTGEFPLKAVDGTIVDLEWTSKGNFLPGLHLCVARDISHRKRYEDELKKSEERFRMVVEHAKELISLIDLQGKITYASPSHKQVLGYTAKELLGKDPLALIHPDDVELARRELEKGLVRGHGTITAVRIRHKNGHWRYIEGSSSLIKDQQGKPKCILAVSRDITDRRLIEEQLRASELRFRSLTSHAPVGIFLTDPKGNCEFINERWAKISGLSLAEAKGRGWVKALHPNDKSRVFEAWQKATESGKEFSEEYRFKRPDGKVTWLTGNAIVLKNERGNTIGYLGTITDITDRKHWERELQKNEQQLRLITDAIPALIAYVDANQCYRFTNKAYTDWFGYPEKSVLGKPVKQVLGEDVYKLVKPYIKKVLAGGRVEFDLPLRYRDGVSRYVHGVYIPHRGDTGKVVGYFTLVSDITEAKQTQNVMKFLAEASRVLASSLDYATTLQSVADLAVPQIADWCGIDLLDVNGLPQQVAVAHKDLKKIALARELRKTDPPDMTAPTGLPLVLRTGKTEYYPVITEEMTVAAARNKRHLQVIRKLGLTSAIIVPLIAQKKPIGAISFVSAESKRPFTQADVYMAEQLASRASSAIENATLYEHVIRERERMNNLVANVPGVVWEAYGKPDLANQRIDFVSNYVETMLGYTVDQWLETPNFWLSIVHPEDKERAAQEATAIFQSGVGGTSRFRWMGKNGEAHWVEAQSSVIKNTHSVPIGMRGVTMDITERMLLERRKDDFISMASHELKTPLTSVKVFTQILQRIFAERNDATTTQYLTRMDEQISKLTNLINDLLNVSKIQAGKLELRRERFSLDELIQETVDTIQQTTDTHRIYVKGSIPKKIYADKDRISQVLINLLSNALKYSTKNRKVIITMQEKDGNAVISVRDFGIGIPQSQQARIFERFYRVNGDADEKIFPGLGMGLFITQEIVSRHNGTIWVESVVGKGSTFYVSLPLKAPTHGSRRTDEMNNMVAKPR